MSHCDLSVWLVCVLVRLVHSPCDPAVMRDRGVVMMTGLLWAACAAPCGLGLVLCICEELYI